MAKSINGQHLPKKNPHAKSTKYPIFRPKPVRNPLTISFVEKADRLQRLDANKVTALNMHLLNAQRQAMMHNKKDEFVQAVFKWVEKEINPLLEHKFTLGEIDAFFMSTFAKLMDDFER